MLLVTSVLRVNLFFWLLPFICWRHIRGQCCIPYWGGEFSSRCTLKIKNFESSYAWLKHFFFIDCTHDHKMERVYLELMFFYNSCKCKWSTCGRNELTTSERTQTLVSIITFRGRTLRTRNSGSALSAKHGQLN